MSFGQPSIEGFAPKQQGSSLQNGLGPSKPSAQSSPASSQGSGSMLAPGALGTALRNSPARSQSSEGSQKEAQGPTAEQRAGRSPYKVNGSG